MIIIKSKNEIVTMREAGRIVYNTHQELKKHLKPGVSTLELDKIAENFIRKHGAIPSFKGYQGAAGAPPFPGSICTSVNEELVHGIPSKRKLKDGDIITIDIGAYYNGYHGDSAWSYPIGQVDKDILHLLEATEKALFAGLEQVKPDARLGDVSHAIQTYAEKEGFSIVREYAGHGIGRQLHESPSIPNFGPPNQGVRLRPGMTLAIEPMLNLGERFVKTLDDDWTVVTMDGSPCAHYEHTIVVTEDGYEIMTYV